MFNLIHTESSIKVDCIVRKKEEYRLTEFERRQKIRLTDFDIYIVSKEDLIISKLIWFKDSNSELQKKDIKNLLVSGYDKDYLQRWILRLNLKKQYEDVLNA